MNAKEKMINALYELLSIKDFIEINVSEVCMIAKIHRTTFYAYYSNLLELLEDAKNHAIEEFKKENNNGPLQLDNFKNQIFLNYLLFVKNHAPLFKAYFKNSSAFKADEDFNTLFNQELLPKAKDKYNNDYTMIYYTTRFFIDGFFSVIKEWMKNNFKESPEEIAKIISRIRVVYWKSLQKLNILGKFLLWLLKIK